MSHSDFDSLKPNVASPSEPKAKKVSVAAAIAEAAPFDNSPILVRFDGDAIANWGQAVTYFPYEAPQKIQGMQSSGLESYPAIPGIQSMERGVWGKLNEHSFFKKLVEEGVANFVQDGESIDGLSFAEQKRYISECEESPLLTRWKEDSTNEAVIKFIDERLTVLSKDSLTYV